MLADEVDEQLLYGTVITGMLAAETCNARRGRHQPRRGCRCAARPRAAPKGRHRGRHALGRRPAGVRLCRTGRCPEPEPGAVPNIAKQRARIQSPESPHRWRATRWSSRRR